MNALVLEHITKEYGENIVLNDISMTITVGSIHGFLGPNGAGKSTTMKIMAGLLAPTSGRVLVNGVELLEDPQTCKQNIGILPEFPPLYEEMTVREYLIFAAEIHKVKKSKLKESLEKAISKLSLQEVENRLIGNLSKGYKQRVGIAQSLIHDPKIILLDEPTAGLDPASVSEIRNLIQELSETHTIFISSHLLHEIQMICDQLTIINHGHIVRSGSTESILNLAQGSTTLELVIAKGAPAAIEIIERMETFNRFESFKEQDKTKLKVYFDGPESIVPKMIKEIQHEAIELYGVRIIRQELEDVFLSLMREDDD